MKKNKNLMKKKYLMVFLVVLAVAFVYVFTYAMYKSNSAENKTKATGKMQSFFGKKENKTETAVLPQAKKENELLQMQGTVSSIGQVKIVIKSASGEESFLINSSTAVFSANGKADAKLQDLRSGMRISIAYEEKNKLAKSITILK